MKVLKQVNFTNADQGIALVTTMAILVVVGLLAVVIMILVNSEIGITETSIRKKSAFQAAEAGIEYGVGQVIQGIAPFPSDYSEDDTQSWWLYIPQEENTRVAFKSGRPDEPPQPIQVQDAAKMAPGFSTKHVFNYYRIISSGKWEGPTPKSHPSYVKILEAGVRLGPIPPGPVY